MSNNSSTRGYLSQLAYVVPDYWDPGYVIDSPLEGESLINFFQEWIVGLTGLPGANVRPRWQPEPPNIPHENVDWAAFGIIRREADIFAAELHYPTPLSYNEIRRHEVLHFLISFYGPNADHYCYSLRDGMQLAQNLEVLSLNSMGLVESGDITAMPELLKEKWLYRADLPFSIRRQIVRDYGVESLVSSTVTFNNELYVETIIN